MKRIMLLSAAGIFALATAASAGESRHTRSDGMKLHIKCVSAGCTVRGKNKGGKWGLVEKGPGGRKNYLKLVAKYEKLGFN